MKKLNLLILTLFFGFISSNVFAHALWIETASTGTIGKEQIVKIFYGEYVEGERDSVSKWYSDIKDFKLWLVGPDQKKTEISTTPGVDYYEATFTPGQNGIYTLVVSHHAKDLGGASRYHFLASAEVSIGKAAVKNVPAVNLLQIQKVDTAPIQLNKPMQLKVLLNNVKASERKVNVFSPNGWTKEVTTDSNGIISFVPPFRGRYVIELSEQDKTAGEHYGKPYQETWSMASYSVEVK